MFPWNFSPFNKKLNNQMGQFDQKGIEKFVKDMMGQMMPSQMQGTMNPQDWMNMGDKSQTNQESTNTSDQTLSYSVFETHHHVFIRIKIKDEEWLSKMRLYHTSNQLIVEHIPNEDDKLTITLPAIVKRKGTSANHKDGILEIKIPKNIDMQYSEIELTNYD
jgi:HSP20 family molecular chaperone IbpA